MSFIFVHNSNFGFPLLNNNTSKLYSSLTSSEKQQLFWFQDGSGTLTLYTGISNIYPNPNLNISYPFVGIESPTANINQNVSIFRTGTYNLSFKYSSATGYTFNNANIYIGGILFDTIATPTSDSWAEYSKVYNCSQAGTIKLSFVSNDNVGGTKRIGITDVALTPVSLNADLSYNNLKDTNIFGSLTVNDLNQNGVTSSSGYIQTPQLLLNGVDVNTSLSTGSINYNYSTMPSITANNIGYEYLSVLLSSLNISSNSITNPTQVSNVLVGYPGTYIISYCVNGVASNEGVVSFNVTSGSTDMSNNAVWVMSTVQYSVSSLQFACADSFVCDISNSTTLYLVGFCTSGSVTLSTNYQMFQATRIA